MAISGPVWSRVKWNWGAVGKKTRDLVDRLFETIVFLNWVQTLFLLPINKYEWKYHFPFWEIKGEHDEKSINHDKEQIKLCLWTFENDLCLSSLRVNDRKEVETPGKRRLQRGFWSSFTAVAYLLCHSLRNDDVQYLFGCPLTNIKKKEVIETLMGKAKECPELLTLGSEGGKNWERSWVTYRK